MATLSFVIPCYRSEGTLGKVVDEIYERMTEIENDGFEMILLFYHRFTENAICFSFRMPREAARAPRRPASARSRGIPAG